MKGPSALVCSTAAPFASTIFTSASDTYSFFGSARRDISMLRAYCDCAALKSAAAPSPIPPETQLTAPCVCAAGSSARTTGAATTSAQARSRNLRCIVNSLRTQIQRDEQAFAFALHQQRHGLRLAGEHALHLFDRADGLAIDGQQHIARLDAGARRGAAHVLDDEAVVELGLRLLFLRQRPHRQAQPQRVAALLFVGRGLLLLLADAAELDVDVACRLVAPHLELDRLARRCQADAAGQLARANDGLTIDLGDHVTCLQAR